MKRLLSLFLLCAVSTAVPMESQFNLAKNIEPIQNMHALSTVANIVTAELLNTFTSGFGNVKSFIVDRPLEAYLLGIAITIMSAKANDFYEKWHEVHTNDGKKISTASDGVRALFATGMSLGMLLAIVTFACTKS